MIIRYRQRSYSPALNFLMWGMLLPVLLLGVVGFVSLAFWFPLVAILALPALLLMATPIVLATTLILPLALAAVLLAPVALASTLFSVVGLSILGIGLLGAAIGYGCQYLLHRSQANSASPQATAQPSPQPESAHKLECIVITAEQKHTAAPQQEETEAKQPASRNGQPPPTQAMLISKEPAAKAAATDAATQPKPDSTTDKRSAVGAGRQPAALA